MHEPGDGLEQDVLVGEERPVEEPAHHRGDAGDEEVVPKFFRRYGSNDAMPAAVDQEARSRTPTSPCPTSPNMMAKRSTNMTATNGVGSMVPYSGTL